MVNSKSRGKKDGRYLEMFKGAVISGLGLFTGLWLIYLISGVFLFVGAYLVVTANEREKATQKSQTALKTIGWIFVAIGAIIFLPQIISNIADNY